MSDQRSENFISELPVYKLVFFCEIASYSIVFSCILVLQCYVLARLCTLYIHVHCSITYLVVGSRSRGKQQ